MVQPDSFIHVLPLLTHLPWLPTAHSAHPTACSFSFQPLFFFLLCFSKWLMTSENCTSCFSAWVSHPSHFCHLPNHMGNQPKGWVHGGGGSVKASRPSSYLFCHLLCGISISWPQMAATTWQTPTQSPGLGPIVYPSGKFLLPLQCLLGAPMP